MKRKIFSLILALILATALLPSHTAIAAVTTAVPGNTYYFDLSGQGISGTVNSALPDTSLKYVPFTYVGDINAYSRQESGVSDKVSISDRMLFIADYNVTTNVSWNTLNSAGLIFGKDYSAYGAEYELRVPSVGSGSIDSYSSPPTTNEWDQILTADSGYIKNYESIASWGQDSHAFASNPLEIMVIRGGTARADYNSPEYASTATANRGYRPVLQADTADLQVITLFLNGGSLGGSETLQIVVSPNESTYTAPGREGITRPAGSSGNYLRWNTQADGTGTDYEPGSNVPRSVTALYANWAPVEQYSLTTGETYYFDLSGITFPGTVNADITWWGGTTIAGLPDTTLHYVPFTYYGTIDAYSLSEPRAATDEWAAANISFRSLFMADYQITYLVTWDQLNEQDLIFGRDYQYNGIRYQLRAPSVGSSPQDSYRYTLPVSCEWNRILEKVAAIKNDDRSYYSMGQDTSINDPDSRIMICYGLVGQLPSDQTFLAGYRPVLQIESSNGLAADGLEVITLNLDGGSLGGGVAIDAVTGSIKLVAKKGSAYTAPSAVGLTRPDEGEYFRWEGSDGNLYAPGASVPAGVTGLTAVFRDPAAPTITTTTLADGKVNEPYSQTLVAEGDAPITWSIVGSLPGGLSLTGDTIFGTPTTAGTFNFTVKAENGAGSDTKALSIKISTPTGTAPTITTVTLPDGMVNAAYSQTLAATGDTPITWSIDSGSLPNGLSLSGSTISGTPTTAGMFTFTVKATNSTSSDTKALSIKISDPPTGVAPTVTTATLPDGTVDAAYSQTLEATGDSPITWSIDSGDLPDGLSLSGSTISGTPTTAGTFALTVKATNSTGSDTMALSIKISTPTGTAPTITTATLPDGMVNAAYSQTLAATGDTPITWSIDSGSLPNGLSLSGSTISGTPTTAGMFTFTVKATNSTSSDTKALSIKISDPTGTAPTITTATLPDGKVNAAYSQTLAATGDTPITWSIESGSLPDGLSLSGSTISGTPTAAGTFTFTVKAQNSKGFDMKELRIVIYSVTPATHTITASAGSGGSISPSGSVSVTAGGSQTFTVIPNSNYSITSVTVDGIDQGNISFYTFTNVSGNHTIHVEFQYTGAGSDDDYILRTLTDSATGITVSGYISADAVLTVGNMTLGSDAACNTIRSWINDEDYVLLLGVDISLSGSFTGPLTITLPVGTQYNGEKVTILHAKREGTLATYTATVRNGKVTFDVTSLSPFAVFLKDSLDDIPETGDSSAAWIWWALLAVSGAGAIALVLIRKKAFQKR